MCGRKLSETCISPCKFLKNNSTNQSTAFHRTSRIQLSPCTYRSPQPLLFFLLVPGLQVSRQARPHSTQLHVMGASRLHPWLNPPSSALWHRWRPRLSHGGAGAWPTPTPSTHTHFLRRIVFVKLFFKYFLYACLSCRVVRAVKSRNQFSIWVYLITQTHC